MALGPDYVVLCLECIVEGKEELLKILKETKKVFYFF